MNYEVILKFWFEEIEPKAHWVKDPEFDRMILARFGAIHRAVAAGETWGWRSTGEGRLAEVIVLDQFSRNMYRDTPKAFAFDPLALILAQEAVSQGFDENIHPDWLSFLYMPYMHSESAKVHEEAVRLFSRPGMEGALDFENKHKAIIDRFGRYPHRNQILGRVSTSEEEEFLTRPGSSF